MSGDYFKNLFSGFVNPFYSNVSNASERMMANVYDSIEENSYSVLRRSRFKGVILSGYSFGILKTKTGWESVINSATPVDLKDGMKRWKLKFTIHEDLYDTGLWKAFSEVYGKSPLESGISEDEMLTRIERMPYLYTDLDTEVYSNLRFGSIVDVSERNRTWWASNTHGDAIFEKGKHSNTTTGDGTGPSVSSRIKFKDGKKGKKAHPKLKPIGKFYDSSTEDLTGNDWWLKILHDVIAEGNPYTGKDCKGGKKYYDYCWSDGGNVGVAHFAGYAQRALLDNLKKVYGEETLVKWTSPDPKHQKSFEFVKKYVAMCTHSSKRHGKIVSKKSGGDGKMKWVHCKTSSKTKWHQNFWTNFVNEYNAKTDTKARRAKMIKVQQDTWKQKYVDKAIAQMKLHKWPINKRNASIALGIINSRGNITAGFSANGGLKASQMDPEEMLQAYVNSHRSPRHAGGRMAIVQKLYPIQAPKERNLWVRDVESRKSQ